MQNSNLSSFNNDKFNRKVIAQNLTKIIYDKDRPLVIALDSDWGTGKTTFVTMWKDLLETDDSYNDKFQTFYFNAWENDYLKDPLLALFSELEKQFREDHSTAKKILDKSKPFLIAGITSLIKMGTYGLLDFDKVNLGDFNEGELIELVGKFSELSLQQTKLDKEIRIKFKESMQNIQKATDKKFIFFIDELDRCRPTFAIELLEVIKHLFDIDNFIFIISIDKEQLSHSVATIYGQNMDTIGYLRRFFDLEYRLPKIEIQDYISLKHDIFKEYTNTEYFEFILLELIKADNYSLRDIDKMYFFIELLLPLIPIFNSDKNYLSVYIVTISHLYAVMITLKIKSPLTYKKIVDYDYDIPVILQNFTLPDFSHYSGLINNTYAPSKFYELIEPIFPLYLELSLELYNQKKTNNAYNDKFIVGLKDSNGNFGMDRDFDLNYLFKNKTSEIISTLEFINGFNLENN